MTHATIKTGRVLHATIISEVEIKEYVKKTAVKTAEFVAAVLADAGKSEDDGQLRNAEGTILRHKSIKSPKQLIAFWEKHKLPVGALARHVKAAWQAAPQKVEKVKAEKPAKATTGKRGRPRKQPATILQIGDYRQGDLNLEVIAA